MVHELKVWPDSYEAVIQETKRYEIRKNDRDFRVGDDLVLREWDPAEERYTGRMCCVEVLYMYDATDDSWGLLPGYCILSIKKIRDWKW